MSENFQVTARKWRPMRFDDVVGQDHVTRTLKNAIREGRLAHAYLFTGQRGCGKTTVARILAKAINCPNAKENGYEPCNKCESCLSITEGRSMDVAEIDGASNNGVEDVRMLRENVKYPPLQGEYKVIIIDEVHMLSNSAFNALLKTLEEPPRHLVFVFATTEVQKVLPTILSRTQRYDFRRMQIEEITGRLRMIADADGVRIDDDALLIVAKKGDGSMRDAQSIFDQLVAYCGMTVDTNHVREALNLIDLDFYFEVTDAIADREPRRAFELSGQIVNRGYDIEEFFSGLLEHFRCLLTASVLGSAATLEVSKSHQDRYLKASTSFNEADVLRLVRLGQSAIERVRHQQPRIVLEVALVEMMMLARALEVNELIQEIRGGAWQKPSVSAVSSTQVAPSVTPANAPRAVAKSRSVSESAAVVSSPVSAPYSAPKTASPKNAVAAQPTPQLDDHGADTGVDNETIVSRWSELGDLVKSKSRGLYAIFPELQFCGLRRSTVYIAVPDRSTGEMATRWKDELQQALRQLFAPGLIFEVGPRDEMHQKAGSPVVKQPEIVEQVAATAANQDLSELEMALIEQLGARQV
jgi:DNA polymerase-3 subunit gamma/tau